MWNERYKCDEYLYGTRPNSFLKHWVASLHGKNVLSLGEGEGRNAVFLAEQGFVVTAIDGSAIGLEKALALARKRGVRIRTIVEDLSTFRIEPGAWDGIISIFCHLPSVVRRDLHARVVAGLAPGGVLVLESYTPRQVEFGTGGPRHEDLLVTLGELREDLKGLIFEHGAEVERDVTEGTGHTGRAAVVQVVARKEPA